MKECCCLFVCFYACFLPPSFPLFYSLSCLLFMCSSSLSRALVLSFWKMLLGIIFWPSLIGCFCSPHTVRKWHRWVPREETTVWHQKGFPSPVSLSFFSSEWGPAPSQGESCNGHLSLGNIKLPPCSCLPPSGLAPVSSLVVAHWESLCECFRASSV